MNDSTRLDDLDAAWDQLVQTGAPGEPLDASSTDALNRLRRLQMAADAPLSDRSRRWIAPPRANRPARLLTPRFNVTHVYALVAALLLVTMTGAFSMSRGVGYSRASATPIPALGGPKMYRVDQSTGSWQAMNAASLIDVPGDSTPGLATTPTAGATRETSIIGLISADGSTVVRFVYRADAIGNLDLNAPAAFEIYDAKAMTLRRRIDSSMQAYAEAISSDGTRLLVIETKGSGVDWSITGLKVYDTQADAIVSTLNLSSATSQVLEYPLVDSTMSHAYVLTRTVPADGQNARDVQVTEYDLATGKAVHGLTIVNLLQDADPTIADVPNGNYVRYHGLPGIGLSPDDQTLFILSPSSPQLTLIDTGGWMQALRPTIETKDHASCFPESPGFFSGITFVNGRIVTTGFVYADPAIGSIDFQKSATCSIELPQTGAVAYAVRTPVANLLPSGWLFRWTTFFTNGTDLFAIGIKQAAPGTVVYSDYGIFRLNPETLAIEAEMDYPIPSTDLMPFNNGFLLAFAPPS